MTTTFSNLNSQFHKSHVPTKHWSAQTRWEKSNFIVHTCPSEHLSEFREFFAMAFPAFRPTKLTFFKRKCSVRQALLHGRQHGRRVHGPVLRLEATLRVCCRRHHNNLSWPHNFDSNEHHQYHCHYRQHHQHLHCHYHYHYLYWVSIHFHNITVSYVTLYIHHPDSHNHQLDHFKV